MRKSTPGWRDGWTCEAPREPRTRTAARYPASSNRGACRFEARRAPGAISRASAGRRSRGRDAHRGGVMRRSAAALIVGSLFIASPLRPEAQGTRNWDEAFRALTDAKNIGDYMKRMSARPHHL